MSLLFCPIRNDAQSLQMAKDSLLPGIYLSASVDTAKIVGLHFPQTGFEGNLAIDRHNCSLFKLLFRDGLRRNIEGIPLTSTFLIRGQRDVSFDRKDLLLAGPHADFCNNLSDVECVRGIIHSLKAQVDGEREVPRPTSGRFLNVASQGFDIHPLRHSGLLNPDLPKSGISTCLSSSNRTPQNFGLALHVGSLSSRDVGLALDLLPSQPEKPYLKCAHNNQPEIESPRPPVIPTLYPSLVVTRDRDFRERHDGYFILFIIGSYLSDILLLGNCLYLAVDKRRPWAGALVVLAVTLDVGAFLSGGFCALPWDWRESWSEDQNSIQRE